VCEKRYRGYQIKWLDDYFGVKGEKAGMHSKKIWNPEDLYLFLYRDYKIIKDIGLCKQTCTSESLFVILNVASV